MKHLKKGRKLSREKDQRSALIKTMLGSLIMHEKIKTTEAKAKEVKKTADGIISKACRFRKKEEKSNLLRYFCGKIPQIAAKKLTGDFISNFDGKTGGYVRIIRLAPRKSDNAKMAILEIIKK